MGPWPQPPLPRRWSGSSTPPFVGREQQFATLEQTWAAVQRGARQVVFVGGEAGAGKSRFVAEAATLLHRHGVPVLLGTCVSDLGRAYDPFVEPLAALLTDLESGALAPAAQGDAGTRNELLRLIAGRTHQTPGVVHRPDLFAAATSALVAAATPGPLVVVLEDLQWAGIGALSLLRFAVERTPDTPMLFLVTVRTPPPDLAPHVSAVVSDLMRIDGVTRLDLPGLVTSEIADYLICGTKLPTPSAMRAASILRDQTAGNPFLLREVCRERAAELAAGVLRSTGLRTPETVRESVQVRLERLDPGERLVLDTGAVIGEEFDLLLLTAALRRSADGRPVAAAQDGGGEHLHRRTFRALESAQARGLVEWVRERGVARFPHALARQAVLDLMGEYDRAAASARVAVALEEEFPAADRRIHQLAHHYSQAAPLGFAEKATDYLEAAGDAAAARLSHADAANLYSRAAGHAVDPVRRDDLRLASGRACLKALALTRARRLAEQVADSGTPVQALRAAVLHEAAAWRANAHDPRSVALLATALGGSAEQPLDRDRILATAALARALSYTGRGSHASAPREDALRWARETDDPGLLAAVLAISIMDGRADGLAERLARAGELTRLADRLDDVQYLGPAAFHRCLGHYVMGDPAALDAAYLDLARVSRATSEPYWTVTLNIITFSLQLARCEFAAARARLSETSRMVADLEEGHGALEGAWSLQSFMVRRETGRLGSVRHLVTGEEDPTQHWAPGLLALYTELELREPAARLLRWTLAGGLDERQRSASWPAVLSFLVDAAMWLEDRDAAEALLARAACHAGRNLVAAEFLAPFGSADRLIGALESLLGRPSAEEHLVTALAMDERMGDPLHRATSLAEYAIHLTRVRGAPGRAQQVAAEAIALCDRYGLPRIRRRLGPWTVPSARRPTPDPLTPRETEVLVLIGRGLSNREIAATLVISEFTAANHVRSILAKISCTNRTQAAMYAVQRGLAPGRERATR